MRSSTYVKEREKLMKLRTNKKIKVTLNSAGLAEPVGQVGHLPHHFLKIFGVGKV